MNSIGVTALAVIGLLLSVSSLSSQAPPTDPGASSRGNGEEIRQLAQNQLELRPSSDDPAVMEPVVPCRRPLALLLGAGSTPTEDSFGQSASTNRPPVAVAGNDWGAFVGAPWRLNGSCSEDLEADRLSHSWRLVSKPQGSNAALTEPESAFPRLIMDMNGDYVAELVVNDGSLNSEPDQVTVSAIDRQPIAVTKTDIPARVGAVVALDGSASHDREGEPIIAYEWTLVEAPSGSTAALTGATTATPSLIPDVAGIYIAELRVKAGRLMSLPDRATVAAQPSAGRLPPFLDPIGAQSVYVDVIRELQLVARDYNGFNLNYSVAPRPLPPGAALDAASGRFRYTPRADQLGDFSLTFTVDNGDRQASETVRFEVTELPPEPGEAGKATLEGIDSDGDGLRDDLQRYIALTYPDSAKIRAALAQEAKVYQEALRHADDKEASMRTASEFMRSGECLFYLEGFGMTSEPEPADALKMQVLNTEDRIRAWFKFNANLAGEVFRSVSYTHRKQSCRFDLDALSN